MKALCSYLPFVFDSLTPFAETVHCTVLKSLVLLILHFISCRNVCKSIKLFLSSTTSISSIGQSGEHDGPNFCVKALSNVTKRGGISNKSRNMCVASNGTKLVFIFPLGKKCDRLHSSGRFLGMIFRDLTGSFRFCFLWTLPHKHLQTGLLNHQFVLYNFLNSYWSA